MMVDVAVVGGGVIGCAVAREIGRGGGSVVVLERSGSESGASWAAAGMLSPLAEADRPDPFLELLLRSRDLYPPFVAKLEAETGRDIGYNDEGTLLVALTPQDEVELRRRWEWQRGAGLPAEWLSAEQVRLREPAVSPSARAALSFTGDHQVDNRLLLGALREAATLAGVRIRRGEAAIRLLSRAGRVTGVQLASGEVVHAAWVVLAGGAWSPELAGLPRRLPVEPVHGELLALRPAERPFRRVLDSPRIYLVPRADGRIIVGATVERIGFERRVTAGGVRRLLSASIELVPALSGAALVETWSGHRPGTPDGRPVLGPDPDLPNLLYATGHYRNGILLTPVTARLLAEVVLHEGAPAELEPFTVSRFAGS